MHKSFPHLLPSLIFAIMLFFIPGWNKAYAYSNDAETQGVILYVKPGANGTCTSWADACELQTALFNAVAGDQIWVAEGTYKPTTTMNREASFQLKSGVAIYGGFPALGGEWFHRNWVTNLTTLSGDIGLVGNSGDNSYHVVTGSEVDGSAELDGFTITAGNATDHGGGMINLTGSPTLNNVIFSGNTAYYGGGMSNNSSNPTLTNVTFSSNTAYYSGGGMYNENSSPMLTNVTFSGNSAISDYAYGGGVYNYFSSPTLIDITFSSNLATHYGGGMYNIFYSNPTLIDVIFNANTASSGGGMANNSSSPSLTDVTFNGNSTEIFGGGMANRQSSSPILKDVTFSFNYAGSSGGAISSNDSNPTLTNVTFSSNSATENGGGMYNWESSPTLTNVTFISNSAAGNGGGLCNFYNSNPNLRNVTFSNNSVTGDYGSGGAMYNNSSCSPTLTNATFSSNLANQGGGMFNANNSSPTLNNVTFCFNSANLGGGMYNSTSSPTLSDAILWGNTPDQISGSATVTYSDIQGGYTGTGNIDVDPLLSPLADNGGFNQTHALGVGSPAIDAGDPTNNLNIDQRAYARPIDGDGRDGPRSDMGSFEYASFPATFQLTLDISGNGVIAKSPDKTEYFWGETVTLTPLADPDWIFLGWGGDASGLDNPLTLTIYEATNITADFRFNAWTILLSVIPDSSGSVIAYPNQPNYHYGDVVTLTALPNPGWSFERWSGDASGSSSQIIVTMNDNLEITANFTQDEYSLVVSVFPEEKGSVTISPLKSIYYYGDEITLTASGVSGWWLEYWSGNVSGNSNPLTFIVVGNTYIVSNFTDTHHNYLPAILK